MVGLLSRGIVLPRVVTSQYGGDRYDEGMLGTGIYFSDESDAVTKYARPGAKGTRMMVICNVALGEVKEYTHFQTHLTAAPDGYDSVNGAKHTPYKRSQVPCFVIRCMVACFVGSPLASRWECCRELHIRFTSPHPPLAPSANTLAVCGQRVRGVQH